MTRRMHATGSRAFAVLAAVAAAGCTLGPDYVRPEVATPPAWRIEFPKAAEVANTQWWKQFGDPVLNDLIETALRENHDVRIAAARVEQFIAALGSTRSQFFPQLVYGVDASSNQASREGFPPIPSPVDREFDLLPGRIRRVLADRPVRPRAAPLRSGTGSRLRERAGEARRRAVGGDRRRDQLHHPARPRPPAGDRRGDGRQFRRERTRLRPALPGRDRVDVGSLAGAVPAQAGARGDPGDRHPDRGGREPDRRCCSAATPATSNAASRSTSSSRRRSPRTCPPTCCSGARTSCRRSRTWSRRTPTSARRARSISRPSR